ncbi:hypothetical protein MMC20_006385 [Loxospora ochrophaea]|nr:hypothetical protein [Loxospora ochrophaea]
MSISEAQIDHRVDVVVDTAHTVSRQTGMNIDHHHFDELAHAARSLSQRTGVDPVVIVIAAMVGTILMSSVLITLLVWVRTLVLVGLVAMSVFLGATKMKKSRGTSVPGGTD